MKKRDQFHGVLWGLRPAGHLSVLALQLWKNPRNCLRLGSSVLRGAVRIHGDCRFTVVRFLDTADCHVSLILGSSTLKGGETAYLNLGSTLFCQLLDRHFLHVHRYNRESDLVFHNRG